MIGGFRRRKIRFIQGVAYPRSGNHLLVKFLIRYFSRDLRVGYDYHLKSELFNYCEYYKHCHKRPCVDPEVNYQKNHDFGLNLMKRKDQPYLIQYRDPIPAVVSLYLRDLRLGNVLENTRGYWRNYALQQLDFWKGFFYKWIVEPPEESLILKYEDFLEDPCSSLEKVVSFFYPQRPVDQEWIREVVRSEPIDRTDKVKGFAYYSPGEFEELLKEVKGEVALERAWRDTKRGNQGR